MNDRAIGLLEQYEIEVNRIRKGRGAFLCDTDRGSLIFKEYTENEIKIDLQNRMLLHAKQQGLVQTEQIVPDREGNLLVKDSDGTAYILKTGADGRECNIADRHECAEAVRLLAKYHLSMEAFVFKEAVPVFQPAREYEKHNRELKRVRKFLKEKGQKSWFEISLGRTLDPFMKQAQEVTDGWATYSHLGENQPECRCLCHGDYQYHNIIRNDGNWCLVNYEKYVRDNPVRDLCLFLRKYLEKNSWSVILGMELLSAYEQVRPLSAYSRVDLYYRLAYPEKFWKIANFYYNSPKAWIPERNTEKLNRLLEQEEMKQKFLEAYVPW